MQLNLERPDYAWFLRGVDGGQALVNDRILTRSFIIAPDALVEDWPVREAGKMLPGDLEPVLALQPEVIVLGTGALQRFPPAAVIGASLSRGIGIEVMANDAAARTYSVLAGEGRRVVAGFMLGSSG